MQSTTLDMVKECFPVVEALWEEFLSELLWGAEEEILRWYVNKLPVK